jgi:hypothetical protein
MRRIIKNKEDYSRPNLQLFGLLLGHICQILFIVLLIKAGKVISEEANKQQVTMMIIDSVS